MKEVNSLGEIIKLNVGGAVEGFEVSKEVLLSADGSNLQKMLSGEHELNTKEDKIFIDRNPKIF